jgi:hypothetical protein
VRAGGEGEAAGGGGGGVVMQGRGLGVGCKQRCTEEACKIADSPSYPYTSLCVQRAVASDNCMF